MTVLLSPFFSWKVAVPESEISCLASGRASDGGSCQCGSRPQLWAKRALLSYSQVRQTKAVRTDRSANSTQLSDAWEMTTGMMIDQVICIFPVQLWRFGSEDKAGQVAEGR